MISAHLFRQKKSYDRDIQGKVVDEGGSGVRWAHMSKMQKKKNSRPIKNSGQFKVKKPNDKQKKIYLG